VEGDLQGGGEAKGGRQKEPSSRRKFRKKKEAKNGTARRHLDRGRTIKEIHIGGLLKTMGQHEDHGEDESQNNLS